VNVPLLTPPEQHWVCPNCTTTAVTRYAPGQVAAEYHPCRGLNGLNAPMVAEHADAKVEAVPWGDMLYGELVQRDGEGRPISAIRTERADGSNDIVALAPSARIVLD
jgi:hypothetical protein